MRFLDHRGAFPGSSGQTACFFSGFQILIWPGLPSCSSLAGIILRAGKKRGKRGNIETGIPIIPFGLQGLFVLWPERLGSSHRFCLPSARFHTGAALGLKMGDKQRGETMGNAFCNVCSLSFGSPPYLPLLLTFQSP